MVQSAGLESSWNFNSIIAFDSEPTYLAELAQERQVYEENTAIVNELRERSEDPASQQNTQTVWGEGIQSVLPVRRRRTKAKGRVLAAPGTSADVDNCQSAAQITEGVQAQQQAVPQVQVVAVKQESLAVFGKIYSLDGASGAVPWRVFLQAMVDAGFAATEAAGSSVNFSKADGSISIHRPHPNPALDSIMLRNIARRMQRWFGWSDETFVLRE